MQYSQSFLTLNTAWKVSKYGGYGKIRTTKNSVFGHISHSVKVTQPLLFFWFSLVFISSPFHLSGGKTNHPRKFWKILLFHVKSDSPHRDTETGCLWHNLSEIWRQIFHFSNHFGACIQNQYQLYNQIKSTFVLSQVFSICYRCHNLPYLNSKSCLTKKRHL